MKPTTRSLLVALVLLAGGAQTHSRDWGLNGPDGMDCRRLHRTGLGGTDTVPHRRDTGLDPARDAQRDPDRDRRHPSSPPAAPPAATEAAPAPSPCPQGEEGPVGAEEFAADLDGDGQADTLGAEGAAGSRYLNARLSGGGTAGALIGPSAAAEGQANEPRVLGVADADGDGRDEVFLRLASGVADPATVVRLVRLVGCELVVVRNQQGEPYTFEIGEGDHRADGVGCVDVDGDGRTELVGLHATTNDGEVVDYTRTVVGLEGGTATNGAIDHGTYTSPADNDAIALLSQVTCGDQAFPARRLRRREHHRRHW